MNEIERIIEQESLPPLVVNFHLTPLKKELNK